VIEGAVCLFAGLHLLLARPELRAVLWRMLTLLFLLMLLLSGGAFWLAQYLAHLWLPSADSWYWQLLSWLLWGIAVALSLLTAAIAFTALGSAAAAPWLDMLAERTEALPGGKVQLREASYLRQVVHSLGNSIRPLFGLLAMGMLALVLFFIPVVGQIAATVIWTWAGIRFLNYELMDPVASRRGWDFARRKQELGQRRFFYLGFGGMALGLMLVPVLNLLVLPAAVVGLTRILHEGFGIQA